MTDLNRDLFLSILALDAYNRGYNQGLVFRTLNDPKRSIGTASFDRQSDIDENGASLAASFYAVAYDWDGTTVISHRGTDSPFDILSGWLAGAGLPTSQVGVALQFYQDVTKRDVNDRSPGNIVLTGHSLGGLAN